METNAPSQPVDGAGRMSSRRSRRGLISSKASIALLAGVSLAVLACAGIAMVHAHGAPDLSPKTISGNDNHQVAVR